MDVTKTTGNVLVKFVFIDKSSLSQKKNQHFQQNIYKNDAHALVWTHSRKTQTLQMIIINTNARPRGIKMDCR